MRKWEEEKHSSVWFYLPINLSELIAVLAKFGFRYHHAENEKAVLCKWLPVDKESKIPLFATHQMGVAGKLIIRRDISITLL